MKEQEIDTYCNIQILEAIKNREKRYAVAWDNEMNESQSKVESNSIKDVHVRIDFPDVSGKQSARSGNARARSPVARIRTCGFRAICSPPSYNIMVHIHT